MSLLGLRLHGRQPSLTDPVPGTALVLRGDPGYSATTWWTASLRLRVSVPGSSPVIVEHESIAHREKTPFTGLTLPVTAERRNPVDVRICWDAVPTIEQRIAKRYQLILAPDAAWRDVLEADPTQADWRPNWRSEQVPEWSPGATLRRGRLAATALVVGHSWDPKPNGAGFAPSGPKPYRYGGKVRARRGEFLGWLLLCVIPAEGPRYGVHLQTRIPRDLFASVLPVAINPADPQDVLICWEAVREAEPVTEPEVAEPEVVEPEAPEPGAVTLAAVTHQPNGSNGHSSAPSDSPGPVEEYLRALKEPKRSTLQAMRQMILEIVPEAEEVISHGVPAFQVDGKPVAGIGAFKAHLSYLPFSGSVLREMREELADYKRTKSSLHFPIDRPLPRPLVEKLIEARLAHVHQQSS